MFSGPPVPRFLSRLPFTRAINNPSSGLELGLGLRAAAFPSLLGLADSMAGRDQVENMWGKPTRWRGHTGGAYLIQIEGSSSFFIPGQLTCPDLLDTQREAHYYFKAFKNFLN